MYHLDGEEIDRQIGEELSDLRPLALFVCLHGVTESRATRDQILEAPEFHDFKTSDYNMVARGIEPGCKPKLDKQGKIESVKLTVQEIKKAVFIIIHHSKLGKLRERIGNAAVTKLQEMGYLYVKGGERAFHAGKDSKTVFQHEIAEKLVEAKKRGPVGKAAEIVSLLDQGEEAYQETKRKQESRTSEKHGKYKKARNGRRKGKS